MQLFNDYIADILKAIKHENKLMYLLGDYNVDLLNVDKHSLTSEFLEHLYTYFCYPIINTPTRVSNNSATLIDNIFSNSIINNKLFDGILYTDISDHFPIFIINLGGKLGNNDQYYNCSAIYSK